MNLMNFFVGHAHAIGLGDFTNILKPMTTALSPSNLISFVINVILLVSGLAAFIYLIIAGFQYITAGGDSEKATKARTGIINAIIGIIVILLAFALVSYVGSLFANGTPTTIQ